MAWERSYNDNPPPGVGGYHKVFVNKPAGYVRASKSGRGTQGDPWIIQYIKGSAGADPHHESNLSMRKGGAPFRAAYLEIHVDGVINGPVERPTVADGVSGGPKPGRRRSGVRKKGGTTKGSTTRGVKKGAAVRTAKKSNRKAGRSTRGRNRVKRK